MDTLKDPIPVGRDGDAFLLAQRADIDAGELNGPAQVHDVAVGTLTPIKPLQVWFKWNTYQGTTQSEYDAALAENEAEL